MSLTAGWSFPEHVSVESIASRDPGDLIAVLEAFQREVAPRLGAPCPRRDAEHLFAGLVSGQMPAAFAETHLMASTGWSWDMLQRTPADVVRRMTIYLAVARAIREGQSLRFEDEEEWRT